MYYCDYMFEQPFYRNQFAALAIIWQLTVGTIIDEQYIGLVIMARPKLTPTTRNDGSGASTSYSFDYVHGHLFRIFHDDTTKAYVYWLLACS